MSRRLLVKSSGSLDLPSKIIFKVLNDTTSLSYYIVGTNITLKDKDGNILTSVASGSLSNIGINPTTSEDVFTIEADSLTTCTFQYSPRLDKVLEFTVPNKKTDISSCFNSCPTLSEVRNITIPESTNLSYFFANCSNLTSVDPFYIKSNVNANYLFLNTKITSNPIINVEEIGDASGLFLGSTINDISSLQNKDLKWTNMSGFINQTPISIIEDLRFISTEYLSFSSNDSATIIRNIQAPNAKGASFSTNTSLIEVSNINIPNATSLYSLFYNCTSLVTVNNITTGLVTDITNGFSNCYALVTAPTLNLSPDITEFQSLFEGCGLLTDASYYINFISNYSGSGFLNCSSTFRYCKSLNIDLSTVQFTKVRDATYMFSDSGLTQLTNLNISSNIIDYMFSNCRLLEQVNNVNFTDCSSANFVFSNCPLLETASASVNSTSNVLSCGGFYASNANLITASFTCTATANLVSLESFFSNCTKLTSFNIDLTNDQTYYAPLMFLNCSSLVTVTGLNWNKVTNSQRMFSGCSSLVITGDFNLILSEDTSYMFYNCSSLETLGNVIMSVSINSTDIFNGCTNLRTIGNVTIPMAESLLNLFNSCTKLTTTGILTFDNATNISYLFNNCLLLETVGNIVAPKVVSVIGAFIGCTTLLNISLSFPKALEYVNCFSGCTNLVTATIGDSDSSVTQINTNSMFSNCLKLTTVNMDLSKVFNPQNMFFNCSLLNLPINNLNIANIGNAYRMFYNTGIISINNLAINIGNTYQPNLGEMFANCLNLVSVNGLSIQTNSNTDLFGYFSGCTHLTSLSNISLNGQFSARFFLDNVGITDIDLSLSSLNENSNCEYFINSCPTLTNITKLEIGGYAETLVNLCANLTSVDTLKINSTYSNSKSYVITSCDSLTTIDEITSNSNKDIGIRGGTSLTTINKIIVPNTPTVTLEATNITTVTEIVSDSLVSLSNFATNTKLSSYPIINTSNVTNYQYSFSNTKVPSYNNNYDLSKAIQLISTFTSCSELTSVVIDDVFTASTVYASGLFSGCVNLTSVTITNASKLRDIRNMFSGSNNITDLVLTGFTSGFEVPSGITDVNKLEALIESAGINEVPSEPYIRIGEARLATISTTVKNNATAKGWILA